MNYYELPEVSSSDLGALRRAFYGMDDNREDLKEVFEFGSLVDAMLSERSKLNVYEHSLREDGGNIIYYTPDTWRAAERLAEALRRDPLISIFLDFMVGQYIFRRTLNFTYEGEMHSIRARCKLDGYIKQFSTALDFKTMAAKTQKDFNKAIDFFDWDKQGAYYMDIARIDRFWIIGICKTSGQIFKFVIERDDATYQRGRAKYAVWAYRWNLLITPFSNILKLAA